MQRSPSHVQIELTTTCNLRCIHCGINQDSYRHETLSWDNFEKVLPFLRRHRPSVELSGHGESLACSRFLPMLRKVVDAGCRVSFFTNATLLTPDLSAQLLDLAGPDRLRAIAVSIDAAEPGLFESIRRRASFADFVANLSALDAAKRQRGLEHPVVTFNFVAMLMNVHQLPAVVRLVRTLGGEELVVADLLEYGAFTGQRVARDLERTRPFFAEAAHAAREEGLSLTITPGLEALIAGAGAPA